MGVKTVFKVLFGTVIAICLITFLTEMYNASSHGNLLRQKIDSSAETALNYYTQESFRQEGDYATVNLPDFVSTLDPTLPYVSGHFYDYPDDPVRQVHDMFWWYRGRQSVPTDGRMDIQSVAALRLNDTFTYTGLGGLGFDVTVKRLPTPVVDSYYSPYNRVLPGSNNAINLTVTDEKAPSQYLGVVNRYMEDVCEVSGWNGKDGTPKVTYDNALQYGYDRLTARLTRFQDNYASKTDLVDYYALGGMDAIKQIVNAHETGYTPINVGFPLFSWQLNQMFRWNLVSALSGAGIETLDGGIAVESSAIMPDDNGVNCVRWNGFNVYVDQAKIDELFYYGYDLYNDTDLDDFCAKTGMNKSDVLSLKKFAASGLEGAAYANTVVDGNGDPHCYAVVVDLHYNVPVGYQGLTAFRRVINWATNQNAGGYSEFLGGPSAASPGTSATYSTNNIGGSVDDDGFVVNSSLQYVMMP